MTTPSFTRWLICLALVLGVHGWPPAAHAGNGRFRAGAYNFCVSVRFNATPSQLDQIRTAFQNASQIFADATDGQQRFGTVTIVNDSGASQSADYWINAGAGRAYATYGQYGVRGEHVNLYFDSNFQAISGADGDAYTIAHEHSHHAFGVLDEYSGPGPGGTTISAECAAPPPPADTTGLSFCLMDNFFTRGGNAGFGIYTLNEYCTDANHDLANGGGSGLHNTYQHAFNGESCWATISAHPRRAAVAPAGAPVNPAPAAHTVAFRNGYAGLRVVLVLDRSGSMSSPSPSVAESRLFLAKAAARQFVDLLNVGDDLGVVTFSDTVTTAFPMTTVAGAATQTAAKTAIDAQVAGGSTDIGDALARARDLLTTASPRSCNEIIVLCTDGDWNVGTPPLSVLGSIVDQGITMFTVGTGFDISNGDHGKGLLQTLADDTGGKFYFAPDPAGLSSVFAQVLAEASGTGLLTRAPGVIGRGGQLQFTHLLERDILSANFLLNFASSSSLSLTLVNPAGVTITPNSDTNGSNVVFFADKGVHRILVRNPVPGIWRTIVNAQANSGSSNAPFTLTALARHDGVRLNASVKRSQVNLGETIIIQASPLYEGAAVPGAQVSGEVVKPDGTREPISLFDDGKALHGDSVAKDGIYSARYVGAAKTGVYAFELGVVNATGNRYAGEDLFIATGAPASSPTNTPAYVRLTTVSAVVNTAPPPTVHIERSGNNVIVSWTPDTTGSVLQGSPTLVNPIWTTLPVLTNPAVLPANGTNRFFRVSRPE